MWAPGKKKQKKERREVKRSNLCFHNNGGGLRSERGMCVFSTNNKGSGRLLYYNAVLPIRLQSTTTEYRILILRIVSLEDSGSLLLLKTWVCFIIRISGSSCTRCDIIISNNENRFWWFIFISFCKDSQNSLTSAEPSLKPYNYHIDSKMGSQAVHLFQIR